MTGTIFTAWIEINGETVEVQTDGCIDHAIEVVTMIDRSFSDEGMILNPFGNRVDWHYEWHTAFVGDDIVWVSPSRFVAASEVAQ